MPKLKEIDVDSEQLKGLVYQLTFEKKLALIKELVSEKNYRENFYSYTESLLEKYNISKMNESQLDGFLHS